MAVLYLDTNISAPKYFNDKICIMRGNQQKHEIIKSILSYPKWNTSIPIKNMKRINIDSKWATWISQYVQDNELNLNDTYKLCDICDLYEFEPFVQYLTSIFNGTKHSHIYLDPKLAKNVLFMQSVILKNLDLFFYANYNLRENKDFVLSIAECNGMVLQELERFGEELRHDRNVVLAAVKQNGLSIEHAPNELKSDPQIALEAIKQNSYAANHISRDLIANREFVYNAVNENLASMPYISFQICFHMIVYLIRTMVAPFYSIPENDECDRVCFMAMVFLLVFIAHIIVM